MTESSQDTVPQVPEVQAENPQIPAELDTQVQAARAVATAHNLLLSGSFKFHEMEALKLATTYLAVLNKSILSDCLEHPQADLVPELKEMKQQLNQH